MKANEAPEKIYLQKYDEDTLICLNEWNICEEWTKKPFNEKISTNIEYTRTDAFFSKAKKWFEENFMNVHKWEIATYEFENIQSMIDEFRKYIEGE